MKQFLKNRKIRVLDDELKIAYFPDTYRRCLKLMFLREVLDKNIPWVTLEDYVAWGIGHDIIPKNRLVGHTTITQTLGFMLARSDIDRLGASHTYKGNCIDLAEVLYWETSVLVELLPVSYVKGRETVEFWKTGRPELVVNTYLDACIDGLHRHIKTLIEKKERG